MKKELPSHFRIRAYGKSELARKYMTGKVSDRSARRFITNCINNNSKLKQRLADAGYRPEQRFFTPIQVQLIVDSIGEP